jgi:hypothetical protein
MSDALLRLSYSPDDNYCGEVTVTVISGAFAGRSKAWFDRVSIKETFIVALKSFPLSSTEPPTLEGGFWNKEELAKIDQCHLRITVVPYDLRKVPLVRVELATQVWKTADADQQHTVTARFLTEYAALDRFASDFELVLDGKSKEAILRGTTAD